MSFPLPPPNLPSSAALSADLGRGSMSTGIRDRPSPTSVIIDVTSYGYLSAHPFLGRELPADKVKKIKKLKRSCHGAKIFQGNFSRDGRERS